MHASRQRLILRAMMNPDEVQLHLLGERSQQRQNIHYLRGLRGQLRLVDVRRQLRRRREIQRQRHILSHAQPFVRQLMLRNVSAQRVAALARVF